MDEYAISWIKGLDYAEVTFPSRSKEKSLLLKMAEEGVDGVKITAVNRDGSVVGHVPLTCVLFRRPPVKREMSEEQKEIITARLRLAQKTPKTYETNEDDILPFEIRNDEI